MKQKVIAIVVGTILTFGYQALSWSVLPTHKNALKYTAAEKELLPAITSAIQEEGVYTLPGTPPGTTHEDAEAHWKENAGKPWVMLTYHSSMSMNMGKMMGVGLLYHLISVWILVWLLSRAASVFNSFGSRFVVCLLFGVFVPLNSTLENMNWFQLPGHHASGEIIDQIVTWGLCGIWLGWYLKPKAA